MEIIVVGIIKSNKNTAPIFWFSPNIKNPEPRLRYIIAPNRRIETIGSGIPLEVIFSTFISKPVFLAGIAEMKIADIANREKNPKKIWYLYF